MGWDLSEMDVQTHNCDDLPNDGIYLFKDYNGTWNLRITREATEEDLEESHIIENEGDIIWQTTLSISHCPYCGIKLPQNSGELGVFTHFDGGNW